MRQFIFNWAETSFSSISLVKNFAITSNWQNTSVFFINFGGMEKFKPFFNKSVSSVFNRESDKFVIISSV